MHDSDLPTSTPTRLVAGDTWEWKISSSHYKASDGWSLDYYLVNSGAAIGPLTSSADGDDHLMTVAAATTVSYTAGTYQWQSFATKAGERHRVGYGTLEIEADFATVGASDQRSHARKMVDALEAALEGRASKTQSSMSIDGVAIAHMSHAELIDARRIYQAEVKREDNDERIRKGLGTKRRILTRFS